MNITIGNPPPILYPIFIGLSILIIALLLAALFDVWRRDSLPGVTYGEISLSPRRMKWVWVAILVGALGFSVNEDHIHERPIGSGNIDAVRAEEGVRRTSVDLPLPFYGMQRYRYTGPSGEVAEEGTEWISIPWPLLSALFAYWILVRRWNPESGRALRLLRGRKWERESAGQDSEG